MYSETSLYIEQTLLLAFVVIGVECCLLSMEVYVVKVYLVVLIQTPQSVVSIVKLKQQHFLEQGCYTKSALTTQHVYK